MRLNGTLGFLGYGNMGTAILRGLIGTGTVEPGQVLIFDPAEGRAAEAKALGVEAVGALAELGRRADVLVLAVKPQTMADALAELGAPLDRDVLVVSIAAGISIGFLQAKLGPKARIVRVMPNTPALVGAGAAAYALGPGCTPEDEETARAIFEAVGIAERVPENLIDTVTALSGSGPAYFFYMVECLIEAAAAQGMPVEQATRLAAQTMLGAGRLLSESGEPAGVLRERVTSKGGTTAAALDAMRAGGFDKVVASAVDAAAARSKELGK